MNLRTTSAKYVAFGASSLRTRAASITARPWSRVWYVVEPRDWSIRWDGRHLQTHAAASGVRIETTLLPSGVRSQVVHYGSRSLYLLGNKLRAHESNRVVFTWFHGSEGDQSEGNQRMISTVAEASVWADAIVTSSSIARQRLVAWGVDESKLHVIPLGVDTEAFRPGTLDERDVLRRTLEIPSNAFCVGSFHKDGQGWDAGDLPKYEKAPEILVEAIGKLAAAISPRPVHILLTGPARGYVKSELAAAGIPYTHVHVPDFRKLPALYRALNTYLIPSRDEGGPKGLLEAMASGIPVVSTKVGMANDIVDHGVTGYLADIDDAGGLSAGMRWLEGDPAVHEKIRTNGRRLSEQYEWSLIAARYADDLYLPLLEAGRSGRQLADLATTRSSGVAG